MTQGYSKDQLYRSRTPTKEQEEDNYKSDLFHPKLCEKSKHIDLVKHRADVPRYEMLNRIVVSFVSRAKSTPIERRES